MVRSIETNERWLLNFIYSLKINRYCLKISKVNIYLMRNWLSTANHGKHHIESLLPSILFIGSITGFIYIATSRDSLSQLLIASASLVLLVVGYKNLVFGLIIAIALMNNAFDLLPAEIFKGSFLKKLWDFGFIYLLLVTATFIPHIFTKRIKNVPTFVKCFYLFMGIIITSFIVSLFTLPDPFIDTFRAFRSYLGYSLIPLLIVIFDRDSCINLSPVFQKFINLFSYLCFLLLLLYNMQFLLQHQFFFGYKGEFNSINGESYLRSIPNFLFLSYFYFWLFLAQWISGIRLPSWKILYIALSCSATLFTFTRGYFLSFFLLCILLSLFLFKSRAINMARFNLIIVLTLFISASAFTTSILQPFIERLASTVADIQIADRNSTSGYRVQLVEDRYKIIQKHGIILGIGFVHPKYAYYRYGPFTGNHLPGELPDIWCADIAWGNIIYQTGILGTTIFILYIAALLYFIAKQLSTYSNELFYLQLASCFELLRHNILTFIGSNYTSDTHDMALFLAISSYLHIIHNRNKKTTK
jgi:hypothetical protein